jgi:hypothetical protein
MQIVFTILISCLLYSNRIYYINIVFTICLYSLIVVAHAMGRTLGELIDDCDDDATR